MPITEIAKILNLHPKAVKGRLQRAGIKPVEYAGPTGMYDASVVEIVRNERPRGRPRKKPAP